MLFKTFTRRFRCFRRHYDKNGNGITTYTCEQILNIFTTETKFIDHGFIQF